MERLFPIIHNFKYRVHIVEFELIQEFVLYYFKHDLNGMGEVNLS